MMFCFYLFFIKKKNLQTAHSVSQPHPCMSESSAMEAMGILPKNIPYVPVTNFRIFPHISLQPHSYLQM